MNQDEERISNLNNNQHHTENSNNMSLSDNNDAPLKQLTSLYRLPQYLRWIAFLMFKANELNSQKCKSVFKRIDIQSLKRCFFKCPDKLFNSLQTKLNIFKRNKIFISRRVDHLQKTLLKKLVPNFSFLKSKRNTKQNNKIEEAFVQNQISQQPKNSHNNIDINPISKSQPLKTASTREDQVPKLSKALSHQNENNKPQIVISQSSSNSIKKKQDFRQKQKNILLFFLLKSDKINQIAFEMILHQNIAEIQLYIQKNLDTINKIGNQYCQFYHQNPQLISLIQFQTRDKTKLIKVLLKKYYGKQAEQINMNKKQECLTQKQVQPQQKVFEDGEIGLDSCDLKVEQSNSQSF